MDQIAHGEAARRMRPTAHELMQRVKVCARVAALRRQAECTARAFQLVRLTGLTRRETAARMLVVLEQRRRSGTFFN